MLAQALKFAAQVLRVGHSDAENPRCEQQAQFEYPAYPGVVMVGSSNINAINPCTTTNLFVTIGPKTTFPVFSDSTAS
jgi:hypothetical protein